MMRRREAMYSETIHSCTLNSATMPILLFKLRHVPEDEAEEIRELLQSHQIDFYETTAGAWGISLPALWLHDDVQKQDATRLMEDYQRRRAERAQSMYAEACNQGKQRKLWALMQESPLKFLASLFAILFVLYLATIPVTFLFHH